MSPKIIGCHPTDDLQTAWQVMVDNRLQNMPVLGDQAKPLGVLDMRDALKVLYEQEQLQEHMMENYIAGIGF
jgi:CBS-domain-containing membrane protein